MQNKQTYRTYNDENIKQTTLGNIKDLQRLNKMIYSPEEIKHFRMDEAINENPLVHKPINMRSKFAYSEIIKNLKPTSHYLLPGQLVCFEYLEPKFKEDLEYYDRTPLTLFFGITRTEDGNIREVGFNLHYYPPFARARVLNTVFEVFRHYYGDKYFNDPPNKPNTFVSYKALKALCNRHSKIAFGVKMYIPVLRSRSYILPSRLWPTAFYTEGHFSKATLAQIQHFWRKY